MSDRVRRLAAAVLRHAWIVAAMLVSLHATLAWLARGPGIFSDQAVYVSLARALREFHYRELFRIDLPFHRMYPPGYPSMLAVWSAMGGGERFDWLVLVAIASSAGALLLFFSAARTIWGSAVALAALVALSVNPALISASGWVLSEAPFMLFASLTLWALAPGRDSRRGALVAATAALAGALTRSAGATLVIAVVAYWIWNRQYRQALTLAAIATLIVGGWLVFTAGAPEQVAGSSYIADAVTRPQGVSLSQAMVNRVSGKLPYLRHVYWQLPVPGIAGTAMDNFVGVPIAVAAILVGIWSLTSRWPAAAVYVAVYGALLAVWPWMLERFITPVVPWLVLAAILGVQTAAAAIKASWHTAALVLAAAFLTLSGIAGSVDVIQRRQPCDRTALLPSAPCVDRRWADFLAAVDYIRTRVPADARLASAEPATLYFYTGHRVVTNAADADYILLSTAGRSAGDVVAAKCRQLTLEAAFAPTAYLFRAAGPAEVRDETAACQAVEDFLEESRTRAQ